ncbi:MAG: NAD(P)/FAD-dependent oxidoreductase [Candidatus Dormibacter sp.]|uniref:NAD(P)/FAD-dependent oxidoreductase n=1 Tax=Candidatus Dormibacter sp. TaxID=2973982 RepID=UPI003D9B27B1
MNNHTSFTHAVVMGAGPAGLTTAYELSKHGIGATVLEKDPEYVGGIARTAQHNGYRFDIGGHRFFSKNLEVEDLWTEILGDEMLTCNRLSRIYYRGKFFDYPLKATNALLSLGPVETVRCMASYAWAKLTPVREPRNLEDWVRNQFGERLFRIFFKTYTEKVWGISTSELSADWAAQRIKGLDLAQVVKNALIPPRQPKERGEVIKTLIDQFRYPRLGPGQLWETVRDLMAAQGQPVQMGQTVERIRHEKGRVVSVEARDTAGSVRQVRGSDFVSSLPIRELMLKLDPAPPRAVLAAARSLSYRDFLSVVLMIRRRELFPDNWIYIHEPGVQVGRIQNFKNWSRWMVPDEETTCLGLEYFCFEDDQLWQSTDEELIALGTREVVQLGMCEGAEIFDGAVVRQRKAYPVYNDVYLDHLGTIRQWLDANVPNLYLCGRNGMHKYNNQDHSMLTALLVARNIAGVTKLDPWKVNADAEYHEEVRDGEQDLSGRQMPSRVREEEPVA